MKKKLSWKLVALYTAILLLAFQVTKAIYLLLLRPEMIALERARYQRSLEEHYAERFASLMLWYQLGTVIAFHVCFICLLIFLLFKKRHAVKEAFICYGLIVAGYMVNMHLLKW